MESERQNRWVMSVDEVRAAEARYSDPKDTGYVATSIQAFYETDPEVIAELLPPPLVPAEEPEVWISIGRMVDFELGVAQVAVKARYGDEIGWYCLHLPMTTESAVIGGRERYGENKKIADITFEREGDHIRASVTRYGITYLELNGDVGAARELPEIEVVPHYYFKYLLAADGNGYDAEPVMVRSVHTRTPRSVHDVEGKLVLRDSNFDPVADLPVVRFLDCYLTDRTAKAEAKAVEKVDGEAFLPYVYQRYDFAGQG
jgi:acetoacetate decarboxylase